MLANRPLRTVLFAFLALAFTGYAALDSGLPAYGTVEAHIPVGRVAEADDIAEAVAVLASGRMGYMTGHALVVDGGWTAI